MRPLEVIVPPERPRPAIICVTVPEPPPEPDTHTPRTEKHPFAKSIPLP